nr:hypothetical protein [Tanacetum cinerariifolium]
QGHTQEDGIDYEEVFALVVKIEAIILFLAYASFMGFMVYQMDVKSAFLYETMEEEVYVYQPPRFEDPDYPNKNTDGDVAFDEKEPKFEGRKPELEVNVFPSSSAQSKKHDDKTKREAKGKSHVESLKRYRNLSAEFKDFSDNSINEDNATGTLVPVVRQLSLTAVTLLVLLVLQMLLLVQHKKNLQTDFNNLETSITVGPIPTTKVHKDHPVTQIIGDLSSATQTRKEPKRVHQALKDPSWIEAMQKELLQFKMQKEEGINYEEVFAPVARIEAIRIFLVYASFVGFMVYLMDVKSAFLYETIKEDVYVCQPLGFEDPDYPDKVYKVVKALYGLHQAPRAWQKGDILLVQIYVDDIIFSSTNKYLLIDGKSASTSIDTEKPLLKDPDGEDVDVHTYRSMIGSLRYLTSSRPDIMFAVCACARFQVTPKASHLHAVNRIFIYLKGKPHLGLWYLKDSPFNLVAYSDSDYAGASLDRKSTTGGCQFLGCRLISWQCKKQTVVITSSTEAEYVAAVALSSMESLKRMLHVTKILSAGYLTTPQMVLNSPCLTHIKNWLVQIKDSSNPLMADNLPKIIWYSTHHIALIKSWLVQKQTALGVNTPRCDEDRLELMELMVFLLPSDEKVGIRVSAVDLQVSAIKLILLLLVQKFLLFGLTNWCCSLNAVSSIKNALTVNPNIYVSYIKQFWTSVTVKKVNDVMRLQALVDKKRVIITEVTIIDAFHLDDAEGVECLPNEEIFVELARMGYEKPSTNLTFYKAFFFKPMEVFDPHHTAMYECQANILSEECGQFNQVLHVSMFPITYDKGTSSDVPAVGVAVEGDVSAADDEVPTVVKELSTPSPTPPTPPPHPSQDQPSTSHDAGISMDLLHNLVDTCTTLTRRVEHLEQDKIAQALEITKLKQRVNKLERRNKLKVLKLRRLKKVGTTQKVETSNDTVMDDVSKQGRMIADMDANVDVTLKDVAADAKDGQDVKMEEGADVQGRKADAARRRNGVVIRDPKETATPSIIIHSEAKSKDKGKGILAEEPKPLKMQAQIEHNEAYARELEAELNKNIDWDEVIDHVQRNKKEDNVVKRYQALKRKPQTEAQARKNMMIYLRNFVGFKMDYFKRMTYDDIRLIFEKYFNSNVAFLQKTKEQIDEEASRALKRLSESQEDKASKKQKLDEEVKELRRHL